jgi:hypothetical protein
MKSLRGYQHHQPCSSMQLNNRLKRESLVNPVTEAKTTALILDQGVCVSVASFDLVFGRESRALTTYTVTAFGMCVKCLSHSHAMLKIEVFNAPSNVTWPFKIHLSQNNPSKRNPESKLKTSLEVLYRICPPQEPHKRRASSLSLQRSAVRWSILHSSHIIILKPCII